MTGSPAQAGDTRPLLSFFIHDLRAGGAERNIVRLVNGVVSTGIRTDLVVVSRSGVYLEELDPRVEVFELPQSRAATAPLGLSRYLNERRPQALISSLTHINIAAILGRALARHRPRLVVTERNQFTRNRELKRGLVRLSYSLVRFLYPRADVIGAVAAGVRDDLARAIGLPASRIEVLHNPVVSKELTAKARKHPTHPWLAARKVPLILSVGRLTRQKNFSLLIRAFAQLRKSRDAKLVILGEGELRRDLLAEAGRLGIAEDVDLPGFDPNPFGYMALADVFASSSDWEGLPTALIEAMACGASIVATDCDSGAREVLENGRFGRLVPVGDVTAMCRALTEAIDCPDDRRRLMARAQDFNLDNSVSRYLDVAGLKRVHRGET
jgi:glycosyltransferase involved in cell wall biosynthesis